MTSSEAADLVATLKAYYPNQKIPQVTVNAYQMALVPMDFAATRAVIEDIVTTEKFFPTVADIRFRLAEVELGAPPVAVAWEQFLDKRAYKHELVERVGGAMGGYEAYTISDNVDVFRAHFMKLYEGMRAETLKRMARGEVRYVEIEAAPREERPAIRTAEPERIEITPEIKEAIDRMAVGDHEGAMAALSGKTDG